MTNELEQEEITSPKSHSTISHNSTPSTLAKLYNLASSTSSSLNSTLYAVTGLKLKQKRLLVSFIFTLVKDFALAYSVRGSLKLIPKLLKMLQILK